MKVLIITRSFDHLLGGMENHTQQVADYLNANNHEVTVLTPELAKGQDPVGDFGHLHIIRTGPMPSMLLKYSFSYWRSVNNFLRNHGREYDVVINSGMSLSLLPRRVAANGPRIVSFFHGTYKYERKSMIHQIRVNPRNLKAYLAIPYCLIFSLLQKRICGISDTVLATSRVVADSLKTDYGVPDTKLRLVENFVDTEKLKFVNRNFAGRPLKLIFLSRLHPEKGVSVLLNAVEKCVHLDNLKLTCLIYGEGEAQREALSFIEKRELTEISLEGPIKHTKIGSALEDGDVFIFPTLREEGLPLSLLEAMSSGLVCIASDVRGPNDIIVHKRNGYLFPVGSADALRKCIKEVYYASNNQSLVLTARRQLEINHSKRTQLASIESIITRTDPGAKSE